MGIRVYKPTSPGRRNSSVSDFAELTDKNKKPEKKLTLKDLVDRISSENIHGETDWAEPQGNEAW